MGWREHHLFWLRWMILLTIFASVSASTYISDSIFGHQIATGRSLLQQKSGCPVNFEFQNYTIITSQCKGPQYPPDICCKAFTEFACPFADQINDLSSDCATIMFSYINIYGKYPPGLFAAECKGDKNGLPCPALAPSESADSSSSGNLITRNPSTGLILATIFPVLLLQLI